MASDPSVEALVAAQEEIAKLQRKVDKLKKINGSLMDRVERTTNEQGGAAFLFQNAVELERKVKERTLSLEAAHDKLVRINGELVLAKEEAVTAMEARSRFFANMSHEIRTPMNGMIGILQLALESSMEDGLRNDLEMVRSSANAMLRLLNDILDFSKLDAKCVALENVRFAPHGVTEDVAVLFSESARKKGLQLHCTCSAALPLGVLGDEGRLRQILNNLVGNAIKFTSQGRVAVEVHVVEQSDQHVLLRWEVSDSGIGLSPPQISSLFQPFVQADTSTTRTFGGTGLGLAIAAELAAAMGGEIGVDSAPARGSKFWFTAKFSHVPAEPSPEMVLKPSPRVLLAIGCVDGLRSVQQSLKALGVEWHVVSASPPSSRLDNPYDCAIVDERIEPSLSLWAKRASKRWISVGSAAQGSAHGSAPELTSPLRRECLWKALRGEAANPTPHKPQKPAVLRIERAESLRVLVVEDNKINQKVTLRSLKRLGIEASLAENGKLAVEAHQRTPFDLIFMDCQMPVMDGYEATRTIRHELPQSTKVPIVAMTANALSGDRERCLDAGMNDYLAKPVSLEMLRYAVLRWTMSAAQQG